MASITARLQKWFSQPQDIVGLATWAGTFGSQAVQYALHHNTSLPLLIGGGVAGLIAITVPNGAAVGADAAKLIVDGANAITAKDIAAAPAILADAQKLAEDATKPAPSA